MVLGRRTTVVRPPLSERRFCLADDRLERRRFADREIGQHLAVDRNTGFGETGNEAAVVEAERADRGVEALNPQSAKAALAPLAVAIGVLICLLDRLLCDPNRVLAAAVKNLGGLEHFLVLGMGGDAALDASHERSPFARGPSLYPSPARGRGRN